MPISWTARVCALLTGILGLALLIIALQLDPSTDGAGTHQQLGLPVCSFIELWGVRCPSCGMTTAWALATRGEWHRALEANVGGYLLAIIALVNVPSSCYFFIRGRATAGGWFSLVMGASLLTALSAATVQWALRIG
jgi:hypothetical protein